MADKKTVPTTRAYSRGDSLEMIDGLYWVVDDSRPLTNNPSQYATDITKLRPRIGGG